MEKHHAKQALSLISRPDLDILQGLPYKDRVLIRGYIEHAIHATCLSEFFSKKPLMEAMVKQGYDRSNQDHRALVKHPIYI